MEKKYQIKLSKGQYKVLSEILTSQEGLNYKLHAIEDGQGMAIDIDKHEASELRDIVEDLINEKGFDENYTLNSKGKILNEFIDIFDEKNFD